MSLWLCIELPRLPLEALAGTDAGTGTDTVIYAQHGPRRWVLASARPSIKAGEALASIQARFPDVRLRGRDTAAEKAALQALGCLAWQLGDRVALIDEAPRTLFDTPFQAVAVDLRPSLKLFGGLNAILGRAKELLAGTPYSSHLGVAPTLEAAAVASRLQLPPLTRMSTLAAQLAKLPLSAFRLPVKALDVLGASGHETLDDVLHHDPASLAARLGPEFPRRLDRLLGRLPDVRRWFTPPPRYRRRLDLDTEIEDWQALLFPLRRLFDEFEAYLRARQVAVTQVKVTLARRRGQEESFLLRCTAPAQRASLFLLLIRERWNARGPQAAASEIRLQADHFVELRPPQAQLFPEDIDTGEAWDGVIDRLRARLGHEALWKPGLAADHRPERAWLPNGATKAAQPLPPRPLWLLRRPVAYARPLQAHTLPERIVGGWWDPQAVARDYQFATGPDGEALWVCFDHLANRWMLHGLVH